MQFQAHSTQYKEKIMYKDFDLPTNHQAKGADYVPPRAREADEIERRRRLPSGTLLAEQQRDGVAISAETLAQLESEEDLQFASRILGASALNTSWYLFAKGAPVMRRRLKLPLLATPLPEDRPDSVLLKKQRDVRLDQARHRADTHAAMVAFSLNELALEDNRTVLGRQIGNTALAIATVDLGDHARFSSPDDFELQNLVRRRSLRTLRDARELGSELHTIPSLAQLANPDSDLAVFWRRNAPNGALSAYEAAYESLAA